MKEGGREEGKKWECMEMMKVGRNGRVRGEGRERKEVRNKRY